MPESRPLNNAMITQERSDGPTPAGGVYSVIYYLNDQFELTPKSLATRFSIEECDADGHTLMTTRGTLNGQLESF